MRQTAEDDEIVYSVIVSADGRILTNFLNYKDEFVQSARDSVEYPNTSNIVNQLALHPDIIEVKSPITLEGAQLGEVRLGYIDEHLFHTLQQYVVFILGFSILVGGSLILITINQFYVHIQEPIYLLNNAAVKFSQGELGARTQVGGKSEINQLQTTFNAMADQIEQNLVEMKKLSSVASRTSNLILICNSTGEIEWANQAFLNATRYRLEEILDKKPKSFLQGERTDPQIIQMIGSKISVGDSFECELICYTKDRKEIWIDIEGQPVFDEKGQLTNYIIIHTDITEKKQADAQLAIYVNEITTVNKELNVQENRLRSLLNITASSNMNKLKLEVEQGAKALGMEFGILAKLESGGLVIEESFAPSNTECQRSIDINESTVCQFVIDNKEIMTSFHLRAYDEWEHVFLHKYKIKVFACGPIVINNRVVGVLYFGSALRDKEISETEIDFFNLLVEWVGVTIERQKSREKLVNYSKELERSNKDLVSFANVASHDLQEPLRKIQTFGGRLESKYGHSLEERGRMYLQEMQISADRMQTLIQELLAYSCVTTQARPFNLTSLQTILDEVISDLEVSIEQA
ncbi:MAG: PAS domain-containing protein, partial [Chloroflexota bacterium]